MEKIKQIINWLKTEKLRDFVTDKEKEFLTSQSPDQQQMINATWKIEALHLLLWVIQ